MKYAVFAVAALGTLPLAFILSVNVRWMKWAFWGMVAAMCLYQQTAINFFSNEFYRGSARGMEVSLIYLLALAIFVVLVPLTRYVSVGSMAAALACPFFALYFFWGNWAAWALCAIAGLTVFWAHRGNLARLRAGEERRLGQ